MSDDNCSDSEEEEAVEKVKRQIPGIQSGTE